MSSVVRPTRPRAAVPRRLYLLLRDGTAIEGVVKVGADQSLVQFLNNRPGWMTLTQARRTKTDDPEGFMIVHAEHIIMASAPDGKVSVQARTATAPDERIVEFVLFGGRAVRGYLPIAPGQRLGDALASANGKFMALSLARLFPEETDVGDIAVQTSGITVVRDLRPSNTAPEPE
jgi:hypothetical protein